MGAKLSTPNFCPRDDQLLFPNEILYQIAAFLSTRDFFWSGRGVCRSWAQFISENKDVFVKDGIGIKCFGSEYCLQQLAAIILRQQQEESRKIDDTEEIQTPCFSISAFFLEKVELTRRQDWSLYSESITRLEFDDCAVLPRTSVITEGQTIETPFHLGCPNLKKLALRNMDKSFMMGGDFLEFSEILFLNNLEELDLSSNKYLTDRIMFDILLKTTKLRAINLSSCQITFASAVHKRFYPISLAKPGYYSDNILSFEKFVTDFLLTDKGKFIRELKIKATAFCNLQRICDPSQFSWECLDISYCREVKARDVYDLIFNHAKTLKKLYLSSDSRGPNCSKALTEISLPHLQYLSIRCQDFPLDDSSCFQNAKQLKSLNWSKILRLPTDPESLYKSFAFLTKLTVLNLSDSNGILDDTFFQVIIRTAPSLIKLNVSGCDKLTDRGIAGIDLEITEKEDTSLNSSLPEWLISPNQVVKEGDENELLLFKLIKQEKFPKELSQETYKSNIIGKSLCDLKYLEDVDFSQCSKLSAASFHFALKLKYLYKLNLSGCRNLSMNALGVISSNCPSLENLTLLRSNPFISQDPFFWFLNSKLTRLKKLTV